MYIEDRNDCTAADLARGPGSARRITKHFRPPKIRNNLHALRLLLLHVFQTTQYRYFLLARLPRARARQAGEGRGPCRPPGPVRCVYIYIYIYIHTYTYIIIIITIISSIYIYIYTYLYIYIYIYLYLPAEQHQLREIYSSPLASLPFYIIRSPKAGFPLFSYLYSRTLIGLGPTRLHPAHAGQTTTNNPKPRSSTCRRTASATSQASSDLPEKAPTPTSARERDVEMPKAAGSSRNDKPLDESIQSNMQRKPCVEYTKPCKETKPGHPTGAESFRSTALLQLFFRPPNYHQRQSSWTSLFRGTDVLNRHVGFHSGSPSPGVHCWPASLAGAKKQRKRSAVERRLQPPSDAWYDGRGII